MDRRWPPGPAKRDLPIAGGFPFDFPARHAQNPQAPAGKARVRRENFVALGVVQFVHLGIPAEPTAKPQHFGRRAFHGHERSAAWPHVPRGDESARPAAQFDPVSGHAPAQFHDVGAHLHAEPQHRGVGRTSGDPGRAIIERRSEPPRRRSPARRRWPAVAADTTADPSSNRLGTVTIWSRIIDPAGRDAGGTRRLRPYSRMRRAASSAESPPSG